VSSGRPSSPRQQAHHRPEHVERLRDAVNHRVAAPDDACGWARPGRPASGRPGTRVSPAAAGARCPPVRECRGRPVPSAQQQLRAPSQSKMNALTRSTSARLASSVARRAARGTAAYSAERQHCGLHGRRGGDAGPMQGQCTANAGLATHLPAAAARTAQARWPCGCWACARWLPLGAIAAAPLPALAAAGIARHGAHANARLCVRPSWRAGKRSTP